MSTPRAVTWRDLALSTIDETLADLGASSSDLLSARPAELKVLSSEITMDFVSCELAWAEPQPVSAVRAPEENPRFRGSAKINRRKPNPEKKAYSNFRLSSRAVGTETAVHFLAKLLTLVRDAGRTDLESRVVHEICYVLTANRGGAAPIPAPVSYADASVWAIAVEKFLLDRGHLKKASKKRAGQDLVQLFLNFGRPIRGADVKAD